MRPRRDDRLERERERLAARITDLEDRLMLLEARVRRSAAEAEGRRTHKPVRVTRPRPRCPGCLLELPKGRRGETCVWCGFVFSAVEDLRPRPRALKAR